MAGGRQDGSWVIHPSLWFDAVCLILLLAGLPFTPPAMSRTPGGGRSGSRRPPGNEPVTG